MAKPPKDSPTDQDAKFERVVERFLKTPPKPHKPKRGDKSPGDSGGRKDGGA